MNSAISHIMILLVTIGVSCTFANDTLFIQSIDFDGDDNQDSSFLNISTTDLRTPVAWTLTIKSYYGVTLFSHSQIDSEQINMFEDIEMFENCTNATERKDEYYFKYLPKFIIRKSAFIRDGSSLQNLFNETIPLYVKRYAIDSLHCDLSKASRIEEELQRRNSKNKLVTVWTMYSPYGEDFPVAYSRVAGKCVPVLMW